MPVHAQSVETSAMSAQEQIVSANARYASAFADGDLASPPARRFAVVTCMDARLDPAKILGLGVGDAHVIRNAGAVVSDDALRSLIISHWLLGTQEAYVIGHTDCGMAKFKNEELHAKLSEEAGADASGIDFLPFSELDQAVRDGVGRIEASELLPDSFVVAGFIYDVKTGRLHAVP